VADAVIVEEFQILAQQPDDSVLVDEVEVIEIVAVAEQGPPGTVGDAGGAFLVNNRFNEIAADETAKQAARANLGLAVIDGGTFF